MTNKSTTKILKQIRDIICDNPSGKRSSKRSSKPYYGMDTDRENEMIHKIVLRALKYKGLDYNQKYDRALANVHKLASQGKINWANRPKQDIIANEDLILAQIE